MKLELYRIYSAVVIDALLEFCCECLAKDLSKTQHIFFTTLSNIIYAYIFKSKYWNKACANYGKPDYNYYNGQYQYQIGRYHANQEILVVLIG